MIKRLACLLVLVVVVGSGCNTVALDGARSATAAVSSGYPTEGATQGRMLIWRACLGMEVTSVRESADRVAELAKQAGGFVDSREDRGEVSADLTLRLPVAALSPTMASLSSLGKVTSQRLKSEDVTEQYVDTDARMKTLADLRDRLRALLQKGQNVKEILEIEKELSRVQAEIDAMQARLNSLKNQAELATVQVTLRRGQILGPVGFVFAGTWWLVGKLFVIQE